MTDPRTQIRQYASQLAEGQRPIEAAEAMSRRGAVRELPEPRRIQEPGAWRPGGPTPWRPSSLPSPSARRSSG